MFSHSRASSLTVYRLICSGTVEDNISKVSSLLPRTTSEKIGDHQENSSAFAPDDNNGILWSVKRKMLESLFGMGKGVDEFGDNGIKREELLFPDDCESEKVCSLSLITALSVNSKVIELGSRPVVRNNFSR